MLEMSGYNVCQNYVVCMLVVGGLTKKRLGEAQSHPPCTGTEQANGYNDLCVQFMGQRELSYRRPHKFTCLVSVV